MLFATAATMHPAMHNVIDAIYTFYSTTRPTNGQLCTDALEMLARNAPCAQQSRSQRSRAQGTRPA